jgi:hypothetical protein
MKGNQKNKETFLDKFIKQYACSGKNHPEGYRWYKKQCNKDFRRKDKEYIRKEMKNME